MTDHTTLTGRERIAFALLLAGLSFEAFAKRLGIARVNVSHWHDAGKIPRKRLEAVSAATGFPVSWFDGSDTARQTVVCRPLLPNARTPANVIERSARELRSFLSRVDGTTFRTPEGDEIHRADCNGLELVVIVPARMQFTPNEGPGKWLTRDIPDDLWEAAFYDSGLSWLISDGAHVTEASELCPTTPVPASSMPAAARPSASRALGLTIRGDTANPNLRAALNLFKQCVRMSGCSISVREWGATPEDEADRAGAQPAP